MGSGDSVQPRNTESVIESVSPELPQGVAVSVVGSDTFIRLQTEGHDVLVEGYEKEPYLRISKTGVVQVNDSSMTTVLNSDRYANVDVSNFVRSDIPKWRTIATDGIAMWHDHRSHWMSPKRPAVIDTKGTVLTWDIPITVDGTVHSVRGSLYLRQQATVLWWLITVVAIGLGVWAALRRRQLLTVALIAVSLFATVVGILEFAGLSGEARITPVLLIFAGGALAISLINNAVRRFSSTEYIGWALNAGAGALLAVATWICADQVRAAYVPGLDTPWLARLAVTAMAGIGIVAIVNGVFRTIRIED